ncbi:TetR/AcrR family transcriptional regulator [Variovorax ureilyticus]|uniref:TetR/AcrR family transcriptional regulator n=1 Tax=Variovorax ureilyticus TaxID=1836198 RepID=A0ABU8VIQ5_9BURK
MPLPDEPRNAAQKRIRAAATKLFADLGATRVSVSELAAAAGVARGTIYNNVGDTEGLFEKVAAQLVGEMAERVERSLGSEKDPAQRMAHGIRLYIRRAHDEPDWGRFMNRFGFSNASMQALWATDPVRNLRDGIESGRYKIRTEQLPSVLGMLTGAVLAAMYPVLEGHRTWRDAGSETAELMLIALGVGRREANRLAAAELPTLVD